MTDLTLPGAGEASEAKGKTVADRWETRWEPEIESLDACDAVIVASPTLRHYEAGMQALDHGIPTLEERLRIEAETAAVGITRLKE